jgi:hypothetical protein
MKDPVSTSGFRFKRTTPDGLVQVLNENSYVMALYNQSTGVASWQRVVLATQKAHVERWLEEHYPSKQNASAPRRSTARA